MKVYTGVGDKGKTQFFGCGMVGKDDIRIETLGVFDELNCVIGLAISFVREDNIKNHLVKIQHTLFQLGADLVGSTLRPDSIPRIQEQHILELEREIDILHDKLGTPKSFIIPGGTKESSFLHLCRAIARRAERCLVNVRNTGVIPINDEMLRYVNRLSDLFYMLARDANKEVPEQTPIYEYFGNRNL